MSETDSPLTALLDPGETLLWSGQPKQGLLLQASDALAIPFSLAWGGFAIFWEATVLGLTGLPVHPHQPTHPVPLFMVFWGIPFVLVGLYLMVGRFFYDAALRRKTWYGVTASRLIIAKSLFTQTVASFDYATMANLNLVERGDHSGDIVLGIPMTLGPRNRVPVAPGFYLIPDARRIYNQIRAAQQAAKK
jgi:cytochrome c oxidase subunit IV